MQNLDLLLINPGNKKQMYEKLGSSLSAIEPPLWIGLIAAFIREKGFCVKVIDADTEGWGSEYTAERIIENNPLLAAIGVMGANPSASSTPKMPAVSEISAILKNKSPEIKVALFGIHPSSLPERTLREERVDFICRGESFYTITKLLETLKQEPEAHNYNIKGLWYMKNSTVIANGWGELVSNLDELPLTAWDLLPMDKYRSHNWHCFENLKQRKPYAVIYTSLGCPFNCAYCNIHQLYSGKPGIRYKSPRKIIDEISLLVKNYRIKNIKIVDELFVLNEDRVIEICDLIIKNGFNLNIWAYARIDTVNKELLRKMKQAGINWLCYGIESGDIKVRDSVIKGQFAQEAIKEAVIMTQEAGINVIANFMFGLPEDDLATMQRTLDLAIELNCEFVNFYCAMAYPGSKLYEFAIKQGWELPKEWQGFSQYGYDALPLPTKYISAKEVLKFRDNAFYTYFNNPGYLNMIERKFGNNVKEHICEMTNLKLKRKLLEQ